MQNKKYLVIIAVLAALLMGAVGVIVGMTVQQKMSAGSKTEVTGMNETGNDEDLDKNQDENKNT